MPGITRGLFDGIIGSGTRRAIRAYERSHGLPDDDAIHRQLLTAMGGMIVRAITDRCC
jgi:peptidoglycan hydrolase-like protein with peptidoglycan-binding domain